MRWSGTGKSDIGRKRGQNQDQLACDPQRGVFLVADGMGGHQGGETASRLATETILEQLRTAQKQSSQPLAAKAAIERANREIYACAQKDPALRGMGTTTTLILADPELSQPQLTIAHVGDSRAYLLTQGSIWQLTRDHSLVQEKLRAGLITREDLRTDKMKNVITRSVGFEGAVEVDVYSYLPRPDDCFLLCSDGLTGLVEDSEILQVARQQGLERGNLEAIASALIALANERGGDDNITVVLARLEARQEATRG